jgi:hypothetical protein
MKTVQLWLLPVWLPPWTHKREITPLQRVTTKTTTTTYEITSWFQSFTPPKSTPSRPEMLWSNSPNPWNYFHTHESFVRSLFLRRSSSSRCDQVVQRLSTTMKTVAKGILKDHLVPVASSPTCSSNLNGFNNAGYKATFRPLKVQVPLTESTLFTPMKYMRSLQRDAILIHWDVWSHHVRGASMQYLALSHLLRFSNENQLKSNKEYGDSLYAVLTLVRTDQKKRGARYTFLGRCTTTRKINRIEWCHGKSKSRMV